MAMRACVTKERSYDRENRVIFGDLNEIPFENYTYDGDGLRRTKSWYNYGEDPPGYYTTTFIWDGGEYLGECTS